MTGVGPVQGSLQQASDELVGVVAGLLIRVLLVGQHKAVRVRVGDRSAEDGGDHAHVHRQLGVVHGGQLPDAVEEDPGLAGGELRDGRIPVPAAGGDLTVGQPGHVLQGPDEGVVVDLRRAALREAHLHAMLGVEGVEEAPDLRRLTQEAEGEAVAAGVVGDLPADVEEAFGAVRLEELTVGVEDPGRLADLGVVEHHERVGIQRHAPELAVDDAVLPDRAGELLLADAQLRQTGHVPRVQQTTGVVGRHTGGVHDGQLRGTAAGSCHGELGVVRLAPLQHSRPDVVVVLGLVDLIEQPGHDDAVAAAERMPELQRGAVVRSAPSAAGQRERPGSSEAGAEELPSAESHSIHRSPLRQYLRLLHRCKSQAH